MLTSRKNRHFQAVLIAIISSVVLLSIHDSSFMKRMEWISYDWRVQQFPLIQAPDDIAIILVDDASLQYMGPVVGRWPWPRSVFADLVEFVSMAEPRAIMFDMLFVESQAGEAGVLQDQRLAEATRENAPVIHAIQLISDREDEVNKSLVGRSLPDDISTRFGLTNPPFINENYNNYLAPINGLHQASAGLGVVSVAADSDGVMRRSPLFMSYKDRAYPALSVAPFFLHIPADKGEVRMRIEKNRIWFDGEWVPTDVKGRYLPRLYSNINNYSASGIFESIANLKAGNPERMLVDPGEFAGKYVFIGASAVGLHDLKATSMGEQVPGVMLHASILGNLLEGRHLQAGTVTQAMVVTVVLTLLGAFGILIINNLWTQLLCPLVLAVAYGVWTMWQFNQGEVYFFATPLVALLLCAITAFSFLLFTEGREKRRVRRMFSRYVSPAALEVMVDRYEDYAAAGTGRKEIVSILFSDIRSFTSLAESISAEKIVQILNHYFSAMTEVALAHNGTIDKFIGDAIMAVWGAPLPLSNHADEAVATGVGMVAALADVNKWLIQQGFNPIEIGIGINTGEAIMGSIGSDQKADYTVIGDNVNLASRLEGLTKQYGCPVLISEATYDALTLPIPCRIVDRVRVKGKKESIVIYEPMMGDRKNAQACVEQMDAGFSAYQQRKWDQALRVFEGMPDDTLATLYRNRCKAFLAEDPGQDWDGTITMTTK